MRERSLVSDALRRKNAPHTLTSLALCAALAEGVRLRLVVLDRQPLLVVVKGRGGQGGGGGGGFGAASRSRLGGGSSGGRQRRQRRWPQTPVQRYRALARSRISTRWFVSRPSCWRGSDFEPEPRLPPLPPPLPPPLLLSRYSRRQPHPAVHRACAEAMICRGASTPRRTRRTRRAPARTADRYGRIEASQALGHCHACRFRRDAALRAYCSSLHRLGAICFVQSVANRERRRTGHPSVAPATPRAGSWPRANSGNLRDRRGARRRPLPSPATRAPAGWVRTGVPDAGPRRRRARSTTADAAAGGRSDEGGAPIATMLAGRDAQPMHVHTFGGRTLRALCILDSSTGSAESTRVGRYCTPCHHADTVEWVGQL